MYTRLIISIVTFLLTVIIWPHIAYAQAPITTVISNTATISASMTVSRTEVISTSYIKTIYMTYNAVGHTGLRTNALDLIDRTELNGLVLDIKGDKGVITYKSDVITATAIGANNSPTIRDWQAFMRDMDERNIYTIARIVVFKDVYMAQAHPEWAVIDKTSGELWLDRENLPWLEPFYEEVWDYNIALAVEAAQRGFDEVQFDYVRFPTDGRISNITYSQPTDTPEARAGAITSFLAKAKAALKPYNVKLAADVFGYTTWHDGDFRIGQDIVKMAAYLDVLSPMLYPSTFNFGLPGLAGYDEMTVAYPYEVVYESMIRALEKVKPVNYDIIVRPWIQDFPDYGFDRRVYTPDEIREQMFGSYDSGGGGWMLWDPRVRYTAEALASTGLYPPNEMGEIMVLRYKDFAFKDDGLTRGLASFRQDLEQLLADGYYPVNLRDLAAGRLNYVPAGKRPIVLTFDGSHISQYKLLANGNIDPNSAMGVLQKFHLEHPADWPMRATFFVQSKADNPDYKLFGQPKLAGQKLQNLIDLGMEVAPYLSKTPSRFKTSSYKPSLIKKLLPDYQIDSLAIQPDKYPKLTSSVWLVLPYNYNTIVKDDNLATLSPENKDFKPHLISRIEATQEAVNTWLEFYRNNPYDYYAATGTIPVR